MQYDILDSIDNLSLRPWQYGDIPQISIFRCLIIEILRTRLPNERFVLTSPDQ